jgi:hypothetical protein
MFAWIAVALLLVVFLACVCFVCSRIGERE